MKRLSQFHTFYSDARALDFRVTELLTQPDEWPAEYLDGPATVYQPFSKLAWLPGDDILDWRAWMQKHALEALAAYEVARREFVVPLPIGTAVEFTCDAAIPGGVIRAGTVGQVSKNGVFIPLREHCIIGNTWSLFEHDNALTSVFDLVEPVE